MFKRINCSLITVLDVATSADLQSAFYPLLHQIMSASNFADII